jgi:hypothetical protein
MSAYISPADRFSDESQLNEPLLTKLPDPLAYAEPYSPSHIEYIRAMLAQLSGLIPFSIAVTRCGYQQDLY